MTFYEVLEIDPRASKEEIERAFRKLARQIHPDLNSGDRKKAEARMKQLNEIRDTLTDPLLRAGYDARLRLEAERARRAPPPRSAAPPPHDEPPPAPSPSERSSPVEAPEPPPPASFRRVLVGALLGGAGAAAIVALSLSDEGAPPAPPRAAALDAAVAPLLAVPTTAAARAPARAAAPPAKPVRAKVRGPAIRTVRLGANVEEVFAAFGRPDRIQPGAQAGDATLHYGALKLEMKNGRVTGGDAAVLR